MGEPAPSVIAGNHDCSAVVYRAILQPSVRLIHADELKMLGQPFHLRLEGFWRRAQHRKLPKNLRLARSDFVIHQNNDTAPPGDEMRSTRAIHALRDEMFDKCLTIACYYSHIVAKCRLRLETLPQPTHLDSTSDQDNSSSQRCLVSRAPRARGQYLARWRST